MKNKPSKHPFSHVFRLAVCLGLLLLVISGVFIVENDEVAVVLRFGKLRGLGPAEQILEPGIHFAFPYLIDEVVRIPTGKVRQLTVSTHTGEGNMVLGPVQNHGYLISGDNNILLMEARVKYAISDPIQFALRFQDAQNVIQGAVSGCMLSLASCKTADELLVTGKAALAVDIQQSAQGILDQLVLGVRISNIELTYVAPPEEVADAFENVNAAAVSRETELQNARAYKEKIVPEAQAEAAYYVSVANTKNAGDIAAVRQSMANYEGLLEQYQKSPELVMSGVLRTRQIELFNAYKSIIVQPESMGGTVVLP